jgi:hypothetical protein
MSKREATKYRVVCEGEDSTISLRAKAADKYEAFEQVAVFLRSKGFDYRVVLVEPSPSAAVAASA